MEKAKEIFNPIPIYKVNLFKNEILGFKQLKSLADEMYDGIDPLEYIYRGGPYNLVKENGEYQLIIKLPFITREDIELDRVSDQLIIRIGGFKRNILLPRQVASTSSVKARYEGQYLRIYFQGGRHGKRKK